MVSRSEPPAGLASTDLGWERRPGSWGRSEEWGTPSGFDEDVVGVGKS